MRTKKEIDEEKEFILKNLRKSSLWFVGGVVITLLSLIIASHIGFSIITLGAIFGGGWYMYKYLKRLDELKKEERTLEESRTIESHHSDTEKSDAASLPKSTLRSRTWSAKS